MRIRSANAERADCTRSQAVLMPITRLIVNIERRIAEIDLQIRNVKVRCAWQLLILNGSQRFNKRRHSRGLI
ncbi:hypothetical protein D3C84_1222780 [compost metagenome]